MADDKKSTTPLYDKHKKVHDLVGKLQDMGEDDYHSNLASHIHHLASEYLHKNKGKDGKVTWSEKGGDDEHKKFTDNIWNSAADKIAKEYLKLSDASIKELKGKKTPEGESVWESMIAQYLGGMNKDDFFERVKGEDELTIENVLKTYVGTISQRHLNYRHNSLLKYHIKKPEDMDSVAAYLGDAKKHNKKALKPLKVPKKFKSLEDAMGTISHASQYLPKNYHPDRKETYH